MKWLLLILVLSGCVATHDAENGFVQKPGIHGEPAPAPACTQEAKICPDGSSVGRTGAECAFAPCPLT